jgi:putative PIN family toxin of toxin-antitoxin system
LRVVFDTNVLLAAFLTEGLCWKLLLKANRKEFFLFTSPYILNEFKSKLSGKFGFSAEEVQESMSLIAEISQNIDHEERGIHIKGVCRDKKDDHILACGIASEADFLVTGDSDLLILKKYKGMKILNPRDFEIFLVGFSKK